MPKNIVLKDLPMILIDFLIMIWLWTWLQRGGWLLSIPGPHAWEAPFRQKSNNLIVHSVDTSKFLYSIYSLKKPKYIANSKIEQLQLPDKWQIDSLSIAK